MKYKISCPFCSEEIILTEKQKEIIKESICSDNEVNKSGRTKWVNFQKMARNEEEGIIFIKLSMVLNDLMQCNNYLHIAKNNPIKSVRVGEAMYFIRLQLAIISEGIEVLSEIGTNKILNDILKRCPRNIMKQHAELLKLKSDENFTNRFTQSRSNITYHYNKTGKLIKKAINHKAENRKPPISRLELPVYDSRPFRLVYADEILDNIMCEHCWKLEIDKNIVNNANVVAVECAKICEKYFQFGYYYIQKTVDELFYG